MAPLKIVCFCDGGISFVSKALATLIRWIVRAGVVFASLRFLALTKKILIFRVSLEVPLK